MVFLQDRNQSLKEKVELMEREVKAMKRRLLDDVRLKKSELKIGSIWDSM